MDYYFTFIKKEQIAHNIYQFHFKPEEAVNYIAGQYMEFHLPHPHADSRGEKRHFTLVSSPSEPDIKIATKITSTSSSFKKALLTLRENTRIRVNELEGDFILPDDKTKKLLFIAGGIGITPYRSMIKYLLDTQQKRDIILLYAAQTSTDVIFKNELDDAKSNGVQTFYYLQEQLPTAWNGRVGFITPEIIKSNVPDYLNRMVYVSGPEKMVEAFETMLLAMGIKDKNFKRDFFDNYTETYQNK